MIPLRPLALVSLLALACLPPRERVLHREAFFGPEVTRLAFQAGQSSHFLSPAGVPCARAQAGDPSHLGWMAFGDDPFACRYDTLEARDPRARLELVFAASLPGDGDFLLLNRIRPAVVGRVEARSSAFGDYFALARVELVAWGGGCRASWSRPLAQARVTGGMERGANFSADLSFGDLSLVGCRAGERLEVRLQLLAESNRGSVELDWFGFTLPAGTGPDELFGLVRRPPAPRP